MNCAVCVTSTDETSYSESGHMLWKIPGSWHPVVTFLHKTRTTVGVNGMLEPLVAEERAYVVDDDGNTVHISIPYNAEGGQRKVRTPE